MTLHPLLYAGILSMTYWWKRKLIGCGTGAWSYIVAGHVLFVIRSSSRPESVVMCSGVSATCVFFAPDFNRRLFDCLLIVTLPVY